MTRKNSKSTRTKVHDAHDRYANQEVSYLPVVQSQKGNKTSKKDKAGKGQSPVFDSRMKSANRNAEQVRKLL